MRRWITHIATIVVVECPFQDGWFGALNSLAPGLHSNTIAMPFSLFSPHITASSLFLGLACPLLGNFTPSAQAICILVVAVCTVSIAHVDFFYWKLHFFCSLQKDVYEELCGLFSNINLSVYSPIFAFISDNATRKNGK